MSVYAKYPRSSPAQYLSVWDIDEIQQVTNNMGRKARILEQNLRAIADNLDRIDGEDAIFAEAFVSAEEFISENSINLILASAKMACIETVEFNHQLFIEHLVNAIIAHQDELVIITPFRQSNSVTVEVNGDALGSIEQYASAVKEAREILGIGKMPPEIASQVWKEKIYGVAREGVRIMKTTKGNDDEGGDEEDITDRYEGLYEKTIETRLSLIPGDLAPFWYLIENGNASADFEGRGGEQYPVFGPTNFLQKAENAIAVNFETAYYKYRDVAEQVYSSLLTKWTQEAAPIEIDDIDDFLSTYINQAMAIIDKEEVVEAYKPGATITKIKTSTGDLETYRTQKGSVKGRKRAPTGGRFIKLKE